MYRNNGVLDKLANHRVLDAIGRDIDAAVDATAPEAVDAWTESLAVGGTDLDELRAKLDTHADDITKTTRAVIDTLAEQLSALKAQAVVLISAAHEKITTLSGQHSDRVATLTAALDAVKQELHAEKVDSDVVLKHTAEFDKLTAELATLDRKIPVIDQLNSERRGILDGLAKARGIESRVRQDAADLINAKVNRRIEVVVQPFGDRDQFTTELKELLRGSNANAASIATVVSTGIDGPALATLVEHGRDQMAAALGITSPQATNIHTWLTDLDADRLAKLETLAPRDRVSLRLRVGDDSRDLSELSPGQRATAILLLIFVVDGRPMLLDQPEDDLDNRFIFEDVVAMIRQQKALTPGAPDRQIIAATHNPNIPMLGDAELVAVLEAGSTTMSVTSHGSIDSLEIRTHIRQVLEGGEEAFMRRYQKYGGIRLELPSRRSRR